MIRLITDLNFEVLLKTKTWKSEIIHTVAMKKFYPTVPQPEDHTAQPNDKIREEQPNSPKTQPSNEIQKRKPGRPRKLQEITPLSESEPKEEVQASSNMRPMRTRKKPTRFRIIHALILGISIAMAEPPITEGVYFAKWPSTIFTDSEWIITTELTFTDAFKTIGALFTHLHNRIWNTTFITKTNITSHLQIHQDPSATQIVLTNYAQKRTNDTLRVLEAISQRLNDIVGTMGIKPPTEVLPTAPRGLINLGGDALKWLFGTPINNDLERLMEMSIIIIMEMSIMMIMIRPISRTSATTSCLVSLLWRKKRFMYSRTRSLLGKEPTASTLETENGYSLFNATEK